MMRLKSYACLFAAALLLATASIAAAQEFRATVKGQVLDSSKAALPGATVIGDQHGDQRSCDRDDEHGRQLHHPVPSSRPVHADAWSCPGSRSTRGAACGSQVSQTATINVAARRRRRHRRGDGFRRVAAPRDEQRQPRHGHRQRAHRRAAAAVAQPDGARRARRRRQLQRAGDLPPSVRQRRARRLVDERRRRTATTSSCSTARRTTPTRAATTSPTCRRRQPSRNSKISTNSYDAQYGRTAGGVVNMSLKSGTNSFHGEVYDYMRRKALAANSFLLNSRSAPKTDQYHRSVRVQRRRPDLQEQDVLPVHRREVPRRHAGAARSARCRRRR